MSDPTPNLIEGGQDSVAAMGTKVFVAMLASTKVSALLAKVGVTVDPNVAGTALGMGLHWLHGKMGNLHWKKPAPTPTAVVSTTSNPSPATSQTTTSNP